MVKNPGGSHPIESIKLFKVNDDGPDREIADDPDAASAGTSYYTAKLSLGTWVNLSLRSINFESSFQITIMD